MRSSALLSRVLLAMLVLVWSLHPTSVRAGAAPSDAVPTLQSSSTTPAVLVSRIDATTLVTAERRATRADADDPFGAGDPGAALQAQAEAPCPNTRSAYSPPAHPAVLRLRRSSRMSGRAPPRATRSA